MIYFLAGVLIYLLLGFFFWVGCWAFEGELKRALDRDLRNQVELKVGEVGSPFMYLLLGVPIVAGIFIQRWMKSE